MSSTYCPNCGTPRVGSFRFCRKCQFDFDSIQDSASAAAPAQSSADKPASAPPTRPPLGGPPRASRADFASYYRSTVYWTWLRFLLVVGGVVAGSFAGATLTPALTNDSSLVAFAEWLIGPAIGGFLGWRLWTALWSSGGR
jgi:hypothetical protein